jgi:small subunit ribosomal protein S20
MVVRILETEAMPNTKTAKKQLQVTKRNNERNRHFKSTLKTAVKKARAAITAAEDAQAAQLAVNAAVKTLYRSATKRIIKKQNAYRHVSRLMRAFNTAFRPATEQPAE